jgi:hypothetical protein
MKYAVHYNGDSRDLCVTHFNENNGIPAFIREAHNRAECLFYNEIPEEIILPWISVYDMDFNKPAITTNHKRLIGRMLRELRVMRNQALTTLDAEQMKCSGDEPTLERIYDVKQRLRDLPESINTDVIRTVDDAMLVNPPLLTTYMHEI